jgi:protocatechuate 3,4-dioxygenase beta subunit
VSSFPLNCWQAAPESRRRGRQIVTKSRMQLEHLEARDVPVTFIPSEISGRVFVDCDLNQIYDPNEDRPLAGVTVTLTGSTFSNQPISITTTTAADGTYRFTSLLPGKYTITETQPADYFDGPDVLGTIVVGPDATPAPPANYGKLGNDQFSDVVIAAGNSIGREYNFIEYVKNSLSGTVFLDLNDNGIQESGEPGISGAKLVLTGTNDLGESINQTIFTGADGTYSFRELRPGNYSITETTPDGFLDGKDTVGKVGGQVNGKLDGNDRIVDINLGGCESGVGYNFGEIQRVQELNSISGFVWVDCDQDGVIDTDEERLAGVTITIDSPTSGTAFTVTDKNGRYEFTGLPAGTYNVRQVLDEASLGLFDSKDYLGTPFAATVGDDQFTNIVIPSGPGQAGVNYNFSELEPSSLAGVVFHDVNGDGVRDAGEVGIPNVQIILSGTNDLGQSVKQTVTTDAVGAYRFDKLRPGVYRIDEVQPEGWITTKNAAGQVSRDSSVPETRGSVVGDAIVNINIAGCESGVNFNFGERKVEVLPNSISGYVYHDVNNDGIRDPGEVGIPGTTIFLQGTQFGGGSVGLITTTDSNGKYVFNNLLPGEYTILEVQPAGYLDGKDAPGTPFGGSAVLGVGQDKLFNIVIPTTASGIQGVEYNFGEVGATISGHIYEDLNDNGVREAGEPLITAPVTITLTGVDDTGASVTRTVVTTTGQYKIDLLRPGQYTLNESQPAGYIDGKDAPGTPFGGTASPPDSLTNIVIGGAGNGVNYDFGERKVVDVRHSISGYVFEDCNLNGRRDSGEDPIAGVTIFLEGTTLGTKLPVFRQTTTDATGKYVFTDLPAGEYVIREVQPAGYLDGPDFAGTPFGGVADGSIGQDRIANINIPDVPTSLAGIEYNFTEYKGELSGFVYQDNNDNGVFDASESPIAGATIVLTGVNDLNQTVTLTAVTDPTGKYQFTGLRPGNYSLTETQPVGYLQGKTSVGTVDGTPRGQLSGEDRIINITVDGCTSGINYNFGEILPASVSGYVYQDIGNGTPGSPGYDDGIRQANEPQIPGVTVTLTGVDHRGNAVTLTTTTGIVPGQGAGYYEFKNLRPGTYTISETQPLGFLDGKDTPGTPTGSNAFINDRISNVVLPPGFNGQNNNFGELPTGGVLNTAAIIRGLVYIDTNQNGTLEAGETGRIPGVTIQLFRSTDLTTPIATTTTDAQGRYEFRIDSPVPGDSYVIAELQPSGWLQGGTNVGTTYGGLAQPGAPLGSSGNPVDRITQITIPFIPPNTTIVGENYNFGEFRNPTPPTKRRFLASSLRQAPQIVIDPLPLPL